MLIHIKRLKYSFDLTEEAENIHEIFVLLVCILFCFIFYFSFQHCRFMDGSIILNDNYVLIFGHNDLR